MHAAANLRSTCVCMVLSLDDGAVVVVQVEAHMLDIQSNTGGDMLLEYIQAQIVSEDSATILVRGGIGNSSTGES